jgi:hypothetical protein
MDGFQQLLWGGKKQFKSAYLYNDVYELPLHIMGGASSGLKGFDIENYDVMKTKVL